MFYIKVMNKDDNDYSMFSTDRYRVSRRYFGNDAPQRCEATIVINEDKGDDNLPLAIDIKSTAYIMSDSGKTIDTIYTNT